MAEVRPACLPMPCQRFAAGAAGNLGPAPKHLCDSVPCNGSRPLCRHECCRLVLSQVLAAGEREHKQSECTVGIPKSPRCPCLFLSQPWEGAGRCCWHPTGEHPACPRLGTYLTAAHGNRGDSVCSREPQWDRTPVAKGSPRQT